MSGHRFPRLFAELRKRAGLVVRQVAERAGMRLQRCYDISADRTVPNEHEIAQLLAAFPLTADEIDAYATEIDTTSTTRFEVAKRLRLQSATATECSAVLEQARLRIDYLSVTANARRARATVDEFARELQAAGLERVIGDDDGFADGWHRRMARFYRNVYRGCGIEFCFEPTKARKRPQRVRTRKRRPARAGKRRFARIAIFEFKLSTLRIAALLFRLLDLGDHRVTRVDVAIDVDAMFGALHLLPPSNPPFEHTTYVTSRGYESESQRRGDELLIRVYDWTAKHGGSRQVTRFEAQVRRKVLSLRALESMPDPFRFATVVGLNAAARNASYADSLVIGDIAFHGCTDRLLRLGVRQRARVRALLRQDQPQPQPSQLFRLLWARKVRQLLHRLGIANELRAR